MKTEFIRNFALVAHIDHGKSTLADRLLEYTNTIPKEIAAQQILDSMDLERERGITIKAHPITMQYCFDGVSYTLNLVDTPGHVDFSAEVLRTLSVIEGVVLLVDGTQGVQAQTYAHAINCKKYKKKIIPVINKIDLPHVDLERTILQMTELLGIDEDEILLVSAKEGIGIVDVLEAIIKRIPPPSSCSQSNKVKAMVFDSSFDQYRGVILYVRIFDGTLQPKSIIRMVSTQKVYEVKEVGIFKFSLHPKEKLYTGEIGYIVAGIRATTDVRIGDIIVDISVSDGDIPPIGYVPPKPMVFCSFYPADSTTYEELKRAIELLHLNDASWEYTPETSLALGFGYRCSFLGILHSDIIQERLEREYNISVIATAARVKYKFTLKDNSQVFIDNPANMPPITKISKIEEPYILATIFTPSECFTSVIELLKSYRGRQKKIEYLQDNRLLILSELPLSEILYNFYDRLKSITHGYASFDYEHIGYKEADLVKVDILVQGELIDELSFFSVRELARERALKLLQKLKVHIPRQQFKVTLQAAIGGKIISRADIPALRKDVTAHCYGGDVTRKRKLLDRQREGKLRLKQISRVHISQDAFKTILNLD